MGSSMRNIYERLNPTLRRIIALLLVVIFTTLAVKFFIGSKVVVKFSGITSITQVQLFLNNEEIFSKNESAKSFTLVNQLGKKRIVIKSPGYEDYAAEYSTYFRGTKIIQATLIERTASSQADLLDSGYAKTDYTIENAKYFDDNQWLAFKLVSKADPSAEANSIVAYFHTNTASWEVLNYAGEEYFFDTDSATPIVPLPPVELYQEYFL